MTELMDTSLMSALLLPDDANKEYHYFNQSVPCPLSLLQCSCSLPLRHSCFNGMIVCCRGRHILICVAKALIYLHKHDIVHLVRTLFTIWMPCFDPNVLLLY